ncbi:creatininase family protein [Alicyclobacillus tolerans]|uniref:Creatinine amidohydrolase n=2 Tax=Alicyclobacillus tolerans TaxID=90970 RepID=A0A1M6M0N4_9BACL|nr:creatininase family protein [Alicyclobacillus montanus]SHJ77015.1 creatinine amidohydrolase [Alicyclobacillus montanus]
MYMMKLTQREYVQQLKKGIDTVLIPIGMLETHGEHCALGTDTLIPREFVKRLDAILGKRIMMAPEIAYGHSWALAPFPGTIDVSQRIFTDYVRHIGEQFFHQGFRHIVLLNGHGGNISALNEVSECLADLGAYVLTIHWWLDYREQIAAIAPAVGHAGEDETSCVLAIDESLVDMSVAHHHQDTLSRKIKSKKMGLRIFPHGNSGDATAASVEKGERIYQSLVPLMVKDIEELWEFAQSE